MSGTWDIGTSMCQRALKALNDFKRITVFKICIIMIGIWDIGTAMCQRALKALNGFKGITMFKIRVITIGTWNSGTSMCQRAAKALNDFKRITVSMICIIMIGISARSPFLGTLYGLVIFFERNAFLQRQCRTRLKGGISAAPAPMPMQRLASS